MIQVPVVCAAVSHYLMLLASCIVIAYFKVIFKEKYKLAELLICKTVLTQSDLMNYLTRTLNVVSLLYMTMFLFPRKRALYDMKIRLIKRTDNYLLAQAN